KMGYYPNIVSKYAIEYNYDLKIPQYDYQEFIIALNDLNINYCQSEFNLERVEVDVEQIEQLPLDNFEGDLLILAQTLKTASKFDYARKSGFVIIDFF
ncbi:TPA: hypothetical protein SE409_001817, partial [Campylobacter coli]|nr:hypothetical protein [Campylobacter coli]EIJ2292814.1 hypothetical protein [Campylobacter coli]EJD4629021.1 hypothetical protein [Campylobacter coli]EJD4634229.1 hypothetical protein [Campylobacter coli]EJF4586632.1 hypothetical protein [Campylobacter coli]